MSSAEKKISFGEHLDELRTAIVKNIDKYVVVDENGSVINPDSYGAYSFVWKNALKGIKNIYVKAFPGSAVGTLTLQTSDPKAPTPVNNDLSTTLQSKTSDYEVRIFLQNYKVAINIK